MNCSATAIYLWESRIVVHAIHSSTLLRLLFVPDNLSSTQSLTHNGTSLEHHTFGLLKRSGASILYVRLGLHVSSELPHFALTAPPQEDLITRSTLRRYSSPLFHRPRSPKSQILPQAPPQRAPDHVCHACRTPRRTEDWEPIP